MSANPSPDVAIVVRIPRRQREAADHERLVEYVSAIYRLHIGIANSQVSEVMRMDDRKAGADMYTQAKEICRNLEKCFGFSSR
jgi:hypothetical protein